ncbi:Beta-lactamase domain protein [Sterolibacterium denitrificans]|uniref:mRNA 3'-end processing factor n=2 Tax=Sterolibacterium denitrificans TaxID=157592 RepID=A0A656Z7I9_9PROT|nr:MBL fold metallo-hydrolase [Sterolibacterium denitrificans]KYC29030.1 mRNA 3'-end processing factor [Sterolibacterium denitrificans]SMB21251.1 Beta-lactamase domain protein [Sterolibacterium denitrificans]
MKIQFLGATNTVTGSKYLVTIGKRRLLVDCGLFQGLKMLRLRNWEPLPIDPRQIDAVILTHAHIDHSGYLPLLVRQGFRGPVHCTPATADLCGILLPDSGHLHEEEADYANRHGFSKHTPALPLYTEADARHCLKQLKPQAFDRDIELGDGISLRFSPAGHILGAACVRLHDGKRTLVFSGDLGRLDSPIMQPPAAIGTADYLVVESTYGDRLHEAGDPLDKLADIITRTTARQGAVIVPVFAVGRAQELMYYIHQLKSAGRIPDIPVYLNSPMAIRATQIFHHYAGEHRLGHKQCEAMLKSVRIVNSAEESRRLNTRSGPMIILAASGMATGGRVVHHLKAFAPWQRNTILFAGFQAAGTRGATILSGAESVKIHGEYVPIRAEVQNLSNLSAHADYAEILRWLDGFGQPPRRTFITHGEPIAADTLRRRIEEQKHWRCTVPDYREEYELT